LRDARGATTEALPALRERRPAASVIAACLSAQAKAPRRSLVARLFGVAPLTSRSRQLYLGAISELVVADELAKLGPDWAILDAVPVGERGEVVSHLVIGPAGVFAVDIVHHQDGAIEVQGDQLTINGTARPYISSSRNAATDAAMSLTRSAGFNVPVQGLLAFIAPQSLKLRNAPDDVLVAGHRSIFRRLSSMPAVFDAEQISAITDAAARPATWRGVVAPRGLGFDPEAFEALRIEVQRAWAARGFWACATIVVGAVVATQLLA
jgi:hypothetical protein